MKSSLKNSIAACILGMVSSTVMAADFAYVAPSQADYRNQMLFERTILDPAAYSADRMPIGTVLEIIAGEHVTVDLGQDLDANITVSFKGGRPRREILNEILTQKGFVWHFRDNNLFIRSAREIQLSNQLYGSVPKEDRYHRPVTWKVPKGITLKKLIHEWAGRARMAVDWKVETKITLGVAATFDGELLPTVNMVLEGLGDSAPTILAEHNTITNVLRVWEFDGVN